MENVPMKYYTLFFLFILSLRSAIAAPPASQPSPHTTNSHLLKRLTLLLHHDEHVIKAQIRRLDRPENLIASLEHIANDPQVALFIRSRALSIATLFPKEPTMRLYTSLILASPTHPFLRRKALQAMAFAFKEKALAPAIACLDAKDFALRRTAIEIASVYPQPNVKIRLEQQLKQEPNLYLQKKLQRILLRWNHPPQRSLVTPTRVAPSPSR